MEIGNQHIGLDQTFKGKKVRDLSGSELLELERFFREKFGVKSFSYDSGGEGDLYTEVDGNEIVNTPIEGGIIKMPHTKITIGGKTYNSWEEVYNDEAISSKAIVVNGLARVVEKNNKVYVDGKLVCDKSLTPVVIVIQGSAESVETQSGDVYVEGNANEVRTQSGNINAQKIECDCSTMSGDIRATIIHGDASTMSGDIRYT